MSRDAEVHNVISSLDLGISRQDALKAIKHEPDYVTKELMSDGSYVESLVYKGTYCKEIYECTPYIYTLFFENDKLVLVDMQDDIDKLRMEEYYRIANQRMKNFRR